MPILIALATIAVGVYFFVIRARNAAHIASDLADVAGDIAGAARRFGFRRRANVHPVESIEDPNLAIGAIASAFAELDDYPTKEQQSALLRGLQGELGLSLQDAEENMILGRWFVSECGGPSPAIARLSRKLYKLDGANAITPLMSIIQQLAQATSSDMSERQTSALADIKRAFHIK